MKTTSPVVRRDYQAALERAAFYNQKNGGYLRISGADRVDFLNRQTSNDMHLLRPEQVVSTVLTSATARILDVLTVLDEGETLGVITLPGKQKQTFQFLRSKIFFMDKVALHDASAEMVQIILSGPQASQALSVLDGEPPQRLNELRALRFADDNIHAIRTRTFAGEGCLLLIPAGIASSLLDTLQQAGAEVLSDEAYDILRIEHGLPAPQQELTKAYTPLEANLLDLISESKGCYTGQEIIARQLTYDKVTRRLVGLKLAEMAAPGNIVRSGDTAIGVVTSVARSPRLGPIALAYLKRPHHEAGNEVSVDGPAAPIPAVATELPFPIDSH